MAAADGRKNKVHNNQPLWSDSAASCGHGDVGRRGEKRFFAGQIAHLVGYPFFSILGIQNAVFAADQHQKRVSEPALLRPRVFRGRLAPHVVTFPKKLTWAVSAAIRRLEERRPLLDPLRPSGGLRAGADSLPNLRADMEGLVSLGCLGRWK